jgi:hypothetical protein
VDGDHLVYHWENDGHTALRHGTQPHEERLTPDEACARWPEYARSIRAAMSG